MSFMIKKDTNFVAICLISKNILNCIEYASRTCYDSYDKMDDMSWEKHIRARVKSNHQSIIEHGSFTVILDYGVDDCYMDVEKDLNTIRTSLLRSNSMLHYIEDYGRHITNYDKPILSISGNLRMWRDYIKYVLTKDITSSGINTMIQFFHIFSGACDNVFTIDIPKLRISVRNIDKDDVFVTEDLLMTKNNSNDIRLSKFVPEKLQLVQEVGEGIELNVLSTDNYVQELLLGATSAIRTNFDKYISHTLVPFIISHVDEIGSITYELKIPRTISHQEVRHRISSYSQRSQRYVMEDNANVYIPNHRSNIKMDKIYKKAIDQSLKAYNQLIELGAKKEDARSILPNSAMSTIIITKPYFILNDSYYVERCSGAAQSEIRAIACTLKEYTDKLFNKYK